MIRLSRQDKFAATFFVVTASIVWTGAFFGWWGESLLPADREQSTIVVSYPVPVAAVGDGSIQGVVNAVVAQTQAEAEPVESGSVERVASTSDVAGQRVVASGDCAGIAEGFPAEIAWRESRCTLGINTGNGYLGYAQIALFHWQGGICSDLDWSDINQYNECVTRLWDGGAGASHWAAG